MKPNGGGVATGKIAAMIDAQFGSYDKFKAEFATAGKTFLLPLERHFFCIEDTY